MKAFSACVVLLASLEVTIAQTDDVCLSVKRTSEPDRVQGAPGKRGPIGLPGLIGPQGQKGDIGECTCDESHIIMLDERVRELTEHINQLRRESEEDRNSLAPLEEQVRNLSKRHPLREDGWFTPGNDYQYVMTTTRQSWQESRRLCQELGGDLAAVGMRNKTTRIIIGRAMHLARYAWIGLNDLNVKGTFVWVDGVSSTTGNAHWGDNEPNDLGGDEDCVEIHPNRDLFNSNDRRCYEKWKALCEKRLV